MKYKVYSKTGVLIAEFTWKSDALAFIKCVESKWDCVNLIEEM